jgi:hypothetical protein
MVGQVLLHIRYFTTLCTKNARFDAREMGLEVVNLIKVVALDSVQNGLRASRSLQYCDVLLGNDSVNTFPLEPKRATIGRLLLGNGSVNTPKTIRDNIRRCFPWSPPRGYITKSRKGEVNSCQKLREFLSRIW